MASQGYLPGFVFHPEQGTRRLPQKCRPVLLTPEPRQYLIRPGFLAMRPHQSEQPWKPTSGLLDTNQFVSVDSTRPVLIDVQALGLQNNAQNKGKSFASGSGEVERSGLNLSVLTDVMGVEAIRAEISQQPFVPDYGFCFYDTESQPTLFYPSSKFYYEKPLLNFNGDLAHKSEIMVHLDGQVAFAGAQTEMKNILSIIAEFYLSNNSTKWRKQSLLVPPFDRLEGSEASAKIHGSLKPETVNVVPLKSPQKTRLRSSPKKKTNCKAGKERVLYRKNYFHSCESLLSIIVDKKRHEKTAFLELKKSGPELNQLLTQFSASIAGTGLALLFSVVCKAASGRVPFCASKLLNTGLGFGLVWLSWAVNRLRDTIIHISKEFRQVGFEGRRNNEESGQKCKRNFIQSCDVDGSCDAEACMSSR